MTSTLGLDMKDAAVGYRPDDFEIDMSSMIVIDVVLKSLPE